MPKRNPWCEGDTEKIARTMKTTPPEFRFFGHMWTNHPTMPTMYQICARCPAKRFAPGHEPKTSKRKEPKKIVQMGIAEEFDVEIHLASKEILPTVEYA